MKAIRRFHVRTVLPEAIAPLHDLAMNLRWAWTPETRDLFESINPEKWEAVRKDPIALFSAMSTEELEALAADQDFVNRLGGATAELQRYLTEPRWFQNWSAQNADAPQHIAYFSAEYGITHVLPQYSGGLGILAGDHLKSASDLGLPLTGIGLFYKSGYFQQALSPEGWQQETYPVQDPDDLPIELVREEDGTPAMIQVAMPGGRTLHARIWKALVGRVTLLLMDSDVEQNEPALRELTNRLYGGGGDQRLQQEMLLGIGGVRVLRLWSRLTGAPEPDVYHANEGHAGFLGAERISELVGKGLTVAEAVKAVRASTVFTTHTPVPAGIDRFGKDQIQLYFGGSNELPGLPVSELLKLGAEDYEGGDPNVFNMAVLGFHLAQRSNGVARLHGAVSRAMFNPLWPGFDASEVPIVSVTNGVHAGTWTARPIVNLAEEVLGDIDVDAEGTWERLGAMPWDRFWQIKRQMREALIADARLRVRESMIHRGYAPAELGWTDEILDPDVLTIGFARRAAPYKRLTLMLHDKERFKRLLLDPERPVQVVVAGKSHPADDPGKKLIQEMVQFADDPEIRHRIVFLPGYDIRLARVLYPGCDVWLNNPLRPMEACGTSGMKAAMNGALNLSVRDGWWDEWSDGENGWDIPTADGVTDVERRDKLESAALYEIIEKLVVPRYYDRGEQSFPQQWMSMVMHTLTTLGPKLQATRQVRDYTTELYTPAAASHRVTTGNDYALAKDLAAFDARVHAAWGRVHIDHVETEGVGGTAEVGDRIGVHAFVDLGELTPEDVHVQLVKGRVNESDDLTDVQVMDLERADATDGDRYRFDGELTLERTGAMGYTVRVVPRHEGLASLAELALVTLPA